MNKSAARIYEEFPERCDKISQFERQVDEQQTVFMGSYVFLHTLKELSQATEVEEQLLHKP